MEVFIVEDNENLREALAGYLRLEGLEVREFGEIGPAESALKRSSPDLMILDVMLPDGDGFLFAQRIRKSRETPFLFLTARDQESDRITGLELGADDYVVKPFSPKEVVLRVLAILRRTQSAENTATPAKLLFSLAGRELVVHEETHLMQVDGKPVTLTAAEWNILIHLINHRPQLFTRLQLLESCLGSMAEGSERTIDTHIKNIRRKLGNENWIETVRGFGYRFNGEE